MVSLAPSQFLHGLSTHIPDYLGEFPGLSKFFDFVIGDNDPIGEGMKALQRLLNDGISQHLVYVKIS